MSVTISGNALACFSSFVNVAGDQIWDPAIRKTTREQQSLATTKLRFDFTLVSVLTWD